MKKSIIIFAALALLCACSSRGTRTANTTAPKPVESKGFTHEEVNGVYYWKTTFDPDTADFNFIRRHNIGRIYLRMFDVSVDAGQQKFEDSTLPVGTLKFSYVSSYRMNDSLARINFVPVVYITLDALKASAGREGRLARNIVERVRNMCSYNSVPNVGELQLDCDWTASTEDSFFALCDSAKIAMREMRLGWRLSSTIRLHQLARKAPPVDYGVLMVYNTGNFKDPDAANSIIDEDDVAPYLKYLDKYKLHLDAAYPTYSWQLLFHKRQFEGLLNGVNVADSSKFKRGEAGGIYICLNDMPYRNTIIRQGDVVREETSKYQDVIKVKTLIEEKLASRQHSNIIYHFDLKNLSKYSDNEISDIFSVN